MSAADSPQTAASGHMRNGFMLMSVVAFPFMAYLPNVRTFSFRHTHLLILRQTGRIPLLRH